MTTTPYQTALAQLASLDVPGVARNYAAQALPRTLYRADLPALLVLPLEVRDDRLFRQQADAFLAQPFSGGARTFRQTCVHWLLVAPYTPGDALRRALVGLPPLVDAYLTTIGADLMLNGALLEPATVRVEPGLFDYGGGHYVAVAFRHRWVLPVGASS